MAYFDGIDDQQLTPEAEAEARRRVLGMIAGAGKPSILGQPQPSTVTPNQPGTRAYDLSVSATNPPNVPPPRLNAAPAPDINASHAFGTKPPSIATPPFLPTRPNVMPRREDFPEGPGLPTWKKVLGLGLATLSGPKTAGPLAEQILNKPKLEADAKFKQATQDWERSQTDAARAATTAEAQARTQSLLNPKPDKPENLDREAYDFYVSQGMTPAAARKQVLADAQDQKPDKTPNFEEQEYQEWAAAQKQSGKPSDRLTFEGQRAQRTQKPEKPQRTLITVPNADGSARVIEATPGMTIPKGAATVTEFGKAQQPTADEQRRADLANNMTENLDQLEEIVKRRPDLFGPMAGRMTTLKSAVGTSDPDIAALQTIKEQMGMAMVGAHAMRNAQHVEAAANAIINSYKNEPGAVAGAISKARQSLATFQKDVNRALPSGGAVHFTEGPDAWDIPAEKVTAFLKAHPNAQRQ